MKHIFYCIAIALVFLCGCDIQKKAAKAKRDTITQNDIVKESTKVTEEKRDGGQIFSGIIPIEQRERDENGDIKELIQTLRDGALTKTIYYKPDGSVDVDCTADEIWTRIEEKLNERNNSQIQVQEKEKDSEKEENFDSSVILYGFMGIAVIMIIFVFFAMRQSKLLNLLVNNN
ncbi:hypothetical protein [Winogradskyella sp.]|uniref:hypothetical protein n=1 Tax=Winogradskyella sp. TaxID=1883156 RepID=UPI003BAA64FC